jgi:hypothetical protein
MKIYLPIICLSTLLMTACSTVPKYVNKEAAPTDAQITFGDRFGGSSILSPLRSFLVNSTNIDESQCSDYKSIGKTSNNWAGFVPKTININIPGDKEIAIYGNYLFHDKHSSYKCQLKPRIYKFIPGESYSIDIAVESKICILSVIQKKSDGTTAVVVPTKVLPSCNKN